MVFEPALTRQDWVGLCALGILALLLLFAAAVALRRAVRKSGVAVVVIAVAMGISGLGLFRLGADRVQSICAVEFASDEVIVHGWAGSVRLPLESGNQVSVDDSGIRLVSGDRSARLPDVGVWAADKLVVDAVYLAREFAGRSR